MELNITELLTKMIEARASDLHIIVGAPPTIRLDGELSPLPDCDKLDPKEAQELIYSVMNEAQIAEFETDNECDLSFGIEKLSRFRLNVYRNRGSVAAAFRGIPFRIKTIEDLQLPSVVGDLAFRHQGLVLVCGPTGSGKSTTLAAIIDRIDRERSLHIVTIEDPIEFIYNHEKSLVSQREVFSDTNSFGAALKRVLRQDPDVILIGEMRDTETILAALTVAETGHLAFGTLHTNDALQTLNRVIDVFPANQQAQVRTQLSFVLEAVLVQQLLPHAGGEGRVMAMEIMLVNPAIRSLIRGEKLEQIPSIIEVGAASGMMSMDRSLCRLLRDGLITHAVALAQSTSPDNLQRMIDKEKDGRPNASYGFKGKPV